MADKTDIILQRIDDLKDSTEQRLDTYNDLLQDHIKRTNILENLHMDNLKRIEKLEEPRKALVFIKSVALYVAAIAGAILTIAKIMEL
jgi:hypothetical protein